MLFLIAFSQLLGLTAAAFLTKFSREPSTDVKLAPRQSRPGTNYQVHTFDQIVSDVIAIKARFNSCHLDRPFP